MNKNLLYHYPLIALALMAGCSQKPNAPQSKITSSATKVYSEAELDKLIVPGMSMAEVTNTFGVPGSETPVKENVVILMYSLPFETIIREGPLRLTGFDITIRDGKVVGWSPIMGESVKTGQPGASQGDFGEQPFEIFLVTDGLTNALKTFEAESSADVSASKVSPDIAFRAKVFAGKSGNESSGEITVILVMNEQAASKLKDLTENNFGKRTLLACRGKVIAIPVITMPVTSKQFMFTAKDSRILEALRSR